MAASTASCEAIWLRKLLVNLLKEKMEATSILCDNQSCIKLSENPVFHDRPKHIDIRCNFIRDCVQRRAVQLQYTLTGEYVADILTKALGKTNFIYFRAMMGMIKNPFQQQKSKNAELRGSYSTDEAVIVAVSWAAVQKAAAQQMRGSSSEASTTQRVLQSQSNMQQANCQNTFLAKREC